MFFVYPSADSAVDLSRHGVLSVSCIFFSQCSPSLLCTTCSLCWRFNDVTLRPKKPYLSLVRYRKLTACFWLLCFLPSVGIVLMAWREFLSDDLIPKLCLCILVNTQVDDYSLAFLLYSSSLYSLSIAGTVISYIITFTVNVNSTAEDRCVTKLCMLVSVVYTVCWTPFLLVQLLEIFGSSTRKFTSTSTHAPLPLESLPSHQSRNLYNNGCTLRGQVLLSTVQRNQNWLKRKRRQCAQISSIPKNTLSISVFELPARPIYLSEGKNLLRKHSQKV